MVFTLTAKLADEILQALENQEQTLLWIQKTNV